MTRVVDASVEVGISTEWSTILDPLRNLSGGLLAAAIVMAVGAVSVWTVVALVERFSGVRGSGFNRIIGIVLAVACIAALPAAVEWGTGVFSSITIPVG